MPAAQNTVALVASVVLVISSSVVDVILVGGGLHAERVDDILLDVCLIQASFRGVSFFSCWLNNRALLSSIEDSACVAMLCNLFISRRFDLSRADRLQQWIPDGLVLEYCDLFALGTARQEGVLIWVKVEQVWFAERRRERGRARKRRRIAVRFP